MGACQHIACRADPTSVSRAENRFPRPLPRINPWRKSMEKDGGNEKILSQKDEFGMSRVREAPGQGVGKARCPALSGSPSGLGSQRPTPEQRKCPVLCQPCTERNRVPGPLSPSRATAQQPVTGEPTESKQTQARPWPVLPSGSPGCPDHRARHAAPPVPQTASGAGWN